jgi:hypothetical protein
LRLEYNRGIQVPKGETLSLSDKHDMVLPSIALSGLDQAQTRFDEAAIRIASVGDPSADGTPVDTVDLSTAAVAFLSARSDVEASLKMVKIANNMQLQVLDLLA